MNILPNISKGGGEMSGGYFDPKILILFTLHSDRSYFVGPFGFIFTLHSDRSDFASLGHRSSIVPRYPDWDLRQPVYNFCNVYLNKKRKLSTSVSILIYDLWFFIFKKNGHRLTLKSLFTHRHPPPENFFWCQMKGMAKIRLFYSGDMALILPR